MLSSEVAQHPHGSPQTGVGNEDVNKLAKSAQTFPDKQWQIIQGSPPGLRYWLCTDR
ncbi:hypothetical protein GQ54DRAFT_299584 [Martensiomyces pterosporus]|nr:hypothetical protein GQ54DRAFT_299584 [Martensiomyces pterosporus]